MGWRRLERWVTISFGIAAVIGISLQAAGLLAPEGSLLKRSAQSAIKYLTELGDISGGSIVLIFLLIMGGNRVMTVLLRGVEKLQEMREKARRIREEGRAEGHAAGRAAGRAEGRAEGHAAGRAEGREEARSEARAELRVLLKEKGLDPDEFLPPGKGFDDSLC